MDKAHHIQESPKPEVSCLKNECDDQLLSFLPVKLRARLLPFQKDGIAFALARGGRCMIADEMGLGKTIQAIAIAYFYKKEWPLLVVTPSSLRYPWVEEIEKWVPELDPEEIVIIQNKSDVGRISTSKVTLLGYGLLTTDARTLIEALSHQHFQVVIVDESHYMKSRNASRSKILLPLVQNADRAILLTGTPALGRPEELFMQIEALFPKKFGTWTEYAKKYCNAHVRYFGKRTQWDCRGASNLSELHRLLSDIMIRRLKSEVLAQLPPKVRQRIPFDLPTGAAKQLNASFEEWEKLMRASASGTENSGDFSRAMGLITRMFKETALAKAGAVKDYIKLMLQNESLKFLVFAHHLSMLQACTEAAVENKVRYIRIDGSVPSSERMHLVQQFQKDPDTRVAILSIQAAGQGLTFTAATHVVFAELYWDPGHIKQAEDRAHRIGQCSCVNIHYLIANGTLDSLLWGMLNRKAGITGSTLNGQKERLQAAEGDREKWDFLSFAEAWTPREDPEEIQNETLFTKCEKEKQHDIRSFFSPRPNKKRPSSPASCSESRSIPGADSESLRSGDTISEAAAGLESDFEPACKRSRSEGKPAQQDCVPRGSQSRPGGASSSCPGAGAEGVQPNPSRAALPGHQGWDCGRCTYVNSSLLPYCEMCEHPRRSPVNLSKEGEGYRDCTARGQGNVSEGCGRADVLRADNSDGVEPDRESPGTEPSTESKERGRGGGCIQAEAHEEPFENSDAFPVYDGLLFCASRNTDRIHLYTKGGESMGCNFVPLDVKFDLWEDLPASFQLKQNRSLIARFVREWWCLTAMKQRILRKSGQRFSSPALALEEIMQPLSKQICTKRYITKADVATASVNKAHSLGGSVQVVTKESRFSIQNKDRSAAESQESPPKKLSEPEAQGLISLNSASAVPELPADPSGSKGYVQAVDQDGNPLCLYCQQPSSQSGQQNKAIGWDWRFCSLNCQEEFGIRSSNSYLRAKVYEAERGVCQLCNQNVQELFLRIRDAPRNQRKSLLDVTWTSQLPLEQLNEMIRSPAEGQFWQADHIQPVASGGGQCPLGNLQTLCTLCHRKRTAQQAKERSRLRRHSLASKHGCDITRFLVKM
ncbi:DNA annealing helicase and endonuclease ZRANB3 [Tachyglossus aculeatus]|uniref:DNA annealing helicase and endonuclease ZRANB3 n=1 Tax=Tachyglossus aculeatus TaxID=9261 RepID=UPI0018F66010|nr:DNA annealing helicase and endonuclease ZRANB3 [Tachyglossus aculeatus]